MDETDFEDYWAQGAGEILSCVLFQRKSAREVVVNFGDNARNGFVGVKNNTFN